MASMGSVVNADKKVSFSMAPSWVLVFPFSASVRDKKMEQVRVRLEVLNRLRAAGLEVACLVNSTKTEVHVVLSATLERLEIEAERAGLRKAVRCNGGLAPFTNKRRHLFGPLVLDEERFFSTGERQELICRIVISTPRFAGAGIDLDALLCSYTAKTLDQLPPGQLSALATLLSGGEPEPMLTHRSSSSRQGLVDTVLGYMKGGPFMLKIAPLHDFRTQEELAQAYACWWLIAPPNLTRGTDISLIDTLHQSMTDPHAAAAVGRSIAVEDAMRDYLGDGHALYFKCLGVIATEMVPLVLVAVVLFAMKNSTSPLDVEQGLTGIAAMIWINASVAHWARTSNNLMHKWGMSKEHREIDAIALRTACAQDREMERHRVLTADNVRAAKATRRDRVLVQLLVIGALVVCCTGIYLLIRWSRSFLFGEPTTAWQVLAMSLLDVARIYLMQKAGREAMLWLDRNDDDITSKEDLAAWQISKHVLFELANNFCSLVISVGYQAFSAGTDWKFVEPPSCFDFRCSNDLRLHVWTIVGVKYLLVPAVVSLYNYIAFARIRSAVRRMRRERTQGGNARKGAQAANKQRAITNQPSTILDPTTGKPVLVQPPRRGLLRLLLGRGGVPLPIAVEADSEGSYGETPWEVQAMLRPYDPYVWEMRRPLDLIMLLCFVSTCSTLAPLLPLAALIFICFKLRVEALELLVMTQRAPMNRSRTMVYWVEALSWIGVLAILATSVDIMFVTPDVEALIARLAASYRASLTKDPSFASGTSCVAGICLTSETQKAEGALYWIIWTCVLAVGLAVRNFCQLIFHSPSLWLLRHMQVEDEVQSLLGLGPSHASEHETSLVLEEFVARYQKTSVDPHNFERPPY